MDDLYAINFAKTEFREAFNADDPERLITLLDPEFVYSRMDLAKRWGLPPQSRFACNVRTPDLVEIRKSL
jgi:hypothetical protein